MLQTLGLEWLGEIELTIEQNPIISAVCLCKEPVECDIPFNFLPYTEGYIDRNWNNYDGFRGKTIERVEYLAGRRNGAMKALLEKEPDTTHVLMVDSYYTNQPKALLGLVADFSLLRKHYPEIIIGGSTWFQDYYFPYRKYVFWDTWTTPEARMVDITKIRGICRVKAVGGIIIFPVSIWKNHPFETDSFPSGCEMNSLCENSGLPCFLSFNVKFFHPNPKRYSFAKTMRVKAGFYRRKIMGRPVFK